jgi:hypothetical protein
MNDTTRMVLIAFGVAVLMGGMMVGMMGSGWWIGGLAALMLVACVALPAVALGWRRLRTVRRPRGLGAPDGTRGGGAAANRDTRPGVPPQHA